MNNIVQKLLEPASYVELDDGSHLPVHALSELNHIKVLRAYEVDISKVKDDADEDDTTNMFIIAEALVKASYSLCLYCVPGIESLAQAERLITATGGTKGKLGNFLLSEAGLLSSDEDDAEATAE